MKSTSSVKTNTVFAVLSATLFSFCSPLFAATINTSQVDKDLRFLASDEMQGRAIGTAQINDVENYIVDQFKDAGLKPLAQLKGYKQAINLYVYTPQQVELSINGNAIDAADIAFSAGHNFSLNKENSQVVHVAAADDLRAAMSSVNQQGGNTLVVIDEAHRTQFVQYQQYLARGSKSLTEKAEQALVMVIANIDSLENYAAKGSVEKSQVTLANVVGVLEANNDSDEYVIYSAHHDHVGTTQALDEAQDVIYNGANDDASGVSAVLNLARYYAAQQKSGQLELKRNIMFVSFTAEESGLLGSKAFVNDVNTDQIVAMINIEMIGKASEFGSGKVWMTGFDRSDLGELLNKANGEQTIYADPYPAYQLFYRSDNASLAKAGVPAHSFSSTQINKDLDYHKVTDEVETLDVEQMTLIINTLANASMPLLTGEVTPKRIDKESAGAAGAFF
ncbi:M28 family peptidase [Thalassotalea sp. HSM 43]|uniref:M28 family peptidase n=1 Tax=Thalassotalea sp. HSM 43 TaxID=2552945 RepID=UPI0010820E8F|nr:M28 family peptidase [Thalassotalea sp. HSM 43]QBY05701.1 M28 family peptidase [Thalassotalea sp. HSM 43]